ncbi:MAG TPA: hypothetical protein VGF97_04985 [Rhizomicrobium sp.]|jgi:hypothetical protein
MYRSILFSAAAIGLMVGSMSARACDLDLTGLHVQGASQIKLPFFPRAPGNYSSIVGVWQVSYSVSGSVVLNTIDTWSGDGNEFLIADKNPIVGNVCAGVWKTMGAHGVQLHHIGWTFDTTGNPTGTLVDDEVLTLNRKATTYMGTFDEKFYDQSGNLIKEVTGNTAATRVTVQ